MQLQSFLKKKVSHLCIQHIVIITHIQSKSRDDIEWGSWMKSCWKSENHTIKRQTKNQVERHSKMNKNRIRTSFENRVYFNVWVLMWCWSLHFGFEINSFHRFAITSLLVAPLSLCRIVKKKYVNSKSDVNILFGKCVFRCRAHIQIL